MPKSERDAKLMKETFGGYMSVDRIAALKFNWAIIKSLTLPTTLPKKSEDPTDAPAS